MITRNLLKNFLKLDFLFYIGQSKKHHIYRAKRFDPSLEKIFKRVVLNQNYEKVGQIKDLFGPVSSPFISIKTFPEKAFDPKDTLYVKLGGR